MQYTYWLGIHPLVNQYDVIRYDQEEYTVIIKLRVTLTDNSVLHTKEYTDINTRKYSFHWQQTDGTWLVRWDNVPHIPKLKSIPHHKHDYQSGIKIVTDSFDISLAEVLEYIRHQLTHPKP